MESIPTMQQKVSNYQEEEAFSPPAVTGINSVKEKKGELSELGYPFIPNRSSLSFDSPSLHPST